jgi:hypothetical protein
MLQVSFKKLNKVSSTNSCKSTQLDLKSKAKEKVELSFLN